MFGGRERRDEDSERRVRRLIRQIRLEEVRVVRRLLLWVHRGASVGCGRGRGRARSCRGGHGQVVVRSDHGLTGVELWTVN